MDLYIYYRVLTGNMLELQQQALAMQTQLAQQYQITSELKRRPEEQDGMHTWMEVYHDVPPHFEAILSDSVAASGLNSLIDGVRHIEQFLDFSPCA